MKKLLVLLLVLGVVSTASAAIVQLGVNGARDGAGNNTSVSASSATITVHCDTAESTYNWYLAITDTSGGNYGTVSILSAAGVASVGDVVDGPFDIYGHITDINADDTTEGWPHAGDHFQTTLTRTGASVQIDLLNDGLGLVDSVTLVPEPMTIALLGLGGLFLRRRK
jgi:hypothetical protein